MTGGAKEGVARRARASRRGAIVESLGQVHVRLIFKARDKS